MATSDDDSIPYCITAAGLTSLDQSVSHTNTQQKKRFPAATFATKSLLYKTNDLGPGSSSNAISTAAGRLGGKTGPCFRGLGFRDVRDYIASSLGRMRNSKWLANPKVAVFLLFLFFSFLFFSLIMIFRPPPLSAILSVTDEGSRLLANPIESWRGERSEREPILFVCVCGAAARPSFWKGSSDDCARLMHSSLFRIIWSASLSLCALRRRSVFSPPLGRRL